MILARNCLPQIVLFVPLSGWVEGLAAVAFRSARLFTAVALVQWAISKLPFASVSKRVFVQNHSYENVFHLHVYFHVNESHFHARERSCTGTLFKTEAQGNPEMVYYKRVNHSKALKMRKCITR